MITIVLKMLKVTAILFVSILLFEVKICCSSPTLTATSKVNESDYYWHDYTGAIPQDALPGGLDNTGSPVYIGKVSYLGLIIPGPVFTTINGTKMYYDYDHSEYNRKTNFKILCTNHPERFQWIETANSKIIVLENEGRLIVGGYAIKSTYIGRKLINGEMLVGKVQASYDKHAGLHVTDTMENAYIYDAFQVLCYNPDSDILVEPPQFVQTNARKENIPVELAKIVPENVKVEIIHENVNEENIPVEPAELVQVNVTRQILPDKPAETIQENANKKNIPVEPAQLVQENVNIEILSNEIAKITQGNINTENITVEPPQYVQVNANRQILPDETADTIQGNANKENIPVEPVQLDQVNDTKEDIPVEAAKLVQIINVNKKDISGEPARIVQVNINKKSAEVVPDSVNDSKCPAELITINIY